MITDLTAGNWYRIWTLDAAFTGTGEKIEDATVIIVSDDKTHPYKITCDSLEAAEKKAQDITSLLKQKLLPLWAIVSVNKEELPPDVLDFELKRVVWFKIAH
jgi:hypothetical protein